MYVVPHRRDHMCYVADHDDHSFPLCEQGPGRRFRPSGGPKASPDPRCATSHALHDFPCAPSSPSSAWRPVFALRNSYTEWFAKGDASIDDARDLIVQFSVFSNLFLLAQLNKVINAPTLDEMREGKEILANEIGVVFRPNSRKRGSSPGGFDPSIVSTEGTVEGGVYSHRAAHFEWLCDVGKGIGLGFENLGKRRLGTDATLHFCDALYSIYGSDDLSVSLGASFAIEHWANAGTSAARSPLAALLIMLAPLRTSPSPSFIAISILAGFWDDLVEGMTKLNKRDGPGVLL